MISHRVSQPVYRIPRRVPTSSPIFIVPKRFPTLTVIGGAQKGAGLTTVSLHGLSGACPACGEGLSGYECEECGMGVAYQTLYPEGGVVYAIPELTKQPISIEPQKISDIVVADALHAVTGEAQEAPPIQTAIQTTKSAAQAGNDASVLVFGIMMAAIVLFFSGGKNT